MEIMQQMIIIGNSEGGEIVPHGFEINQVVKLVSLQDGYYLCQGVIDGEAATQYVYKDFAVYLSVYNAELATQPSTTLCDFYKTSHKPCYPKGMTHLFSMQSCRSDKYSRVKGVNVIHGIQAMVKEFLIDHFNDNFFNRPKWAVVKEYQRLIYHTVINPFDKSIDKSEDVDASHIAALHDLGYLPIKLKAVKEGTILPVKTPFLTIENTHEDFFWLTNYLETLISTQVWGAITSATTAYEYNRIAKEYAWDTVGNFDHVPFQIHDFSMRGMFGVEAAKISGMAHLLFSKGTDTIPAIHHAEQYYGADITKEIVGTSIVATEHSIMSSLTPADGDRDETAAFEYLLDNNPTGFMSVVSDTYDFWKVIGEVLPKLKDKIMARDGRLVIRPDSGDPADILTGKQFDGFVYESEISSELFEKAIKFQDKNGDNIYKKDDDFKELYTNVRDAIFDDWVESKNSDKDTGSDSFDVIIKSSDGKHFSVNVSIENFEYYEVTTIGNISFYVEDLDISELEQKGLVEALWDIFGGTETARGYKQLDSHISVIYGDSITPERAADILYRLQEKGFASSNVVFGVGSYTYQHVTRDTHGQAIKATWAKINGEEVMLFKDPKTDDGTKRSLRGRVAVLKNPMNGKIETVDGLTEAQEKGYENNMLEVVFENGELKRFQSLSNIREILGTN